MIGIFNLFTQSWHKAQFTYIFSGANILALNRQKPKEPHRKKQISTLNNLLGKNGNAYALKLWGLHIHRSVVLLYLKKILDRVLSTEFSEIVRNRTAGLARGTDSGQQFYAFLKTHFNLYLHEPAIAFTEKKNCREIFLIN